VSLDAAASMISLLVGWKTKLSCRRTGRKDGTDFQIFRRV
jgi:hypothetical protein